MSFSDFFNTPIITFSLGTAEMKIKKYEKLAETFLDSLERDGEFMYGKKDLDKEILLMKDWYARLKEKYKHDKEKLVKIAEDWKDYIFHQSQFSSGNYLWLESGLKDDGGKEQRGMEQEIKENLFAIQEIENRFAHLLGEECEKQLKILRKPQKRHTSTPRKRDNLDDLEISQNEDNPTSFLKKVNY